MRQASTAAGDSGSIRAIDSALMTKVFFALAALAALALLSVAISIGGKAFGRSIAMAGHTDDASLRQVLIGDNIISAPANTIRFEKARRERRAQRLDLYLRWPELDGYSDAARADFNHVGGSRRILFLSIEEQTVSRDMSGRFAPIYSRLLVRPGVPGPAGVTLYGFDEKSGYLNELLAVAEGADGALFVARCLTGPVEQDSLAPCERDILVGNGLSLTYRFPKELLGDWRALDQAIRARAGMMVTARR